MKRNNSDYISKEPDLFPSPKKLLLTRSFSNSKSIKRIPINDKLIGKMLLQAPETIFKQLNCLSESLNLKFAIKSDQYNIYLEITAENIEEKNKENFEIFSEQFANILDEMKGKINETTIPCNNEEYDSISKRLKTEFQSSSGEISFINCEEFSNKPLILKEFIINDIFLCNLVLIENSKELKLDIGDNLVINYERNGIFLDDFMYTQEICPKINKFFKKNKVFFQKDEIFEANLNEFKVFLQIFDSKELLEDNFQLKMIKIYLQQILDRILYNKQYINLYYPLNLGLEKEIIKAFLKSLIDLSKSLGNEEDLNFLAFPTKFSFICHEKQKDYILEIFEQLKKTQSLDENPKNIKHGGYWNLNNNQNSNNFGLFNAPQINSPTQYKLPKKISSILEKSYILGEIQGLFLVDEQKLDKIFNNVINTGVYNRNYNVNNNNLNNQLENYYKQNLDEITIDLQLLSENSKITATQKLVEYNERNQEYTYFDVTSNTFQPYEPELNKALIFYKKIHMKKLIFHLDFQTMKPVESLFSFDLKTFTTKKEGPVLNTQQSPQIINSSFIQPSLNMINQINPNKIYPISRKTDEKYDKHLFKILSCLNKNNPNTIFIAEPEEKKTELEEKKEKPLITNFKCPQLLIRSFENSKKISILLMDFLKKKQISYHMAVKQDSHLLKKTLESLCLRNNVSMKLFNKKLTLQGNYKTINKLRREVLKIVEMDLEDAIYPNEWESQDENLKEVEILDKSEEFIKILKAFESTAPNHKIKKITRIQNKKLWENYVFERKRLEFKGDATEKMLFHGTRNNDPSKIYTGIEEGFDVRLANHGMVGKGIYFAEQAIYSVSGFAYMKSNGLFLIIYANVLVGRSSDSGGGNLIMPPLLPNDSNLRYDSVKAGTNYTVYNSNRAYPAYLIEYSGNVVQNAGMPAFGGFNFGANANNNLIMGNVNIKEEEEEEEDYS